MTNVVSLREDQRRLPASEAAEHALLGAMLCSPAAIDAVAGFLLPDHFFFAGHGGIYEAALALHRQGRRVDALTMAGVLSGREEFDAIGGNAYLADLQAGVISVSNAADYGRMIVDMALRRDLIAAGEEIAADARRADIERPGHDQAEDAVRRVTAIAEASTAPNSGPRPIGDFLETTLEQLAAVASAKGEIVGASTGLLDIDRLTGGLLAPDLTILAARPGMGKTALALNVARHVAEHAGPVVFHSLEMSCEQLMQRLIAAPTGIPVERQRAGPIRGGEFATLQDAAQEITRLPLYLDDGQQRTVAAMRAHARRMKRRSGLALIVVDYLQLMVKGQPQYRVQEVSDISRELKMLAKDVGVPVIAISQLSRAVEQRQDKRPQLSDLRESGSIEQDADVVMFIYREAVYLRGPENADRRREAEHLAEIIIDKNRHGRVHSATVNWDGVRQAFSDRPGAGQEEML